MPSWSGLNDDIYGVPYALMQARPPISGLLKVAFRRRGLHPWAELIGGTVADTYKRVDATQVDLVVPGGVSPPTTVTIPNAGMGGVRTIATVDNLDDPAPTATQIGDVADEPVQPLDSLNVSREYAVDLANNGVTAPVF